MKKCILQVILLISISLFCFSPLTATANCLNNQYNINFERSAKIGWRYKIINGIMYKRLYDYTNKRWIGDWIKVE